MSMVITCVCGVCELYLRQGQFRTFSTKSLLKVIGRIEMQKKVCRYIYFFLTLKLTKKIGKYSSIAL